MRFEINKSIKDIAANFPFYCVKLKEDQFNILTEKGLPKAGINNKKRKAFINYKVQS